eukprot:TRINITY_DN82202_c0_g1_i1.p1 TRINITY_DN82202_c0_g1~~TRINITY_DN82202_c0_g1_i1.p1  ORF type:complete len:276 (+),score=36.76 TRINITY_DN82202_c0_g1_i1:148-975(+)
MSNAISMVSLESINSSNPAVSADSSMASKSFESLDSVASLNIALLGCVEVIVVLGQTLNADGSVPLTLTKRAEGAAELYKRKNAVADDGNTPEPVPVLATGGNQACGPSCTEAEVMQAMLLGYGVPLENIALEPKARNTCQNAWEVAALLPACCRRIALVTSDFHMPRALYTFEAILAFKGLEIELEAHPTDSGCPVGVDGVADPVSFKGEAINGLSLYDRLRWEECFIRDRLPDRFDRKHIPDVQVTPPSDERRLRALAEVTKMIAQHPPDRPT